jgi:hypothetical protein
MQDLMIGNSLDAEGLREYAIKKFAEEGVDAGESGFRIKTSFLNEENEQVEGSLTLDQFLSEIIQSRAEMVSARAQVSNIADLHGEAAIPLAQSLFGSFGQFGQYAMEGTPVVERSPGGTDSPETDPRQDIVDTSKLLTGDDGSTGGTPPPATSAFDRAVDIISPDMRGQITPRDAARVAAVGGLQAGRAIGSHVATAGADALHHYVSGADIINRALLGLERPPQVPTGGVPASQVPSQLTREEQAALLRQLLNTQFNPYLTR